MSDHLIDLTEAELELAWAAGFFDGEGTSYLMWQKLAGGEKRGYPSLSVSQKDRRPLDRFAAAIGIGRVRGENSRLHQWHVSGEKAVAVMKTLYPLLSEPKQEQWDETLAKIGGSYSASRLRRRGT